MKQTRTQKENPVQPRAKKKTSLDLKNARIVFFQDADYISDFILDEKLAAFSKAGYNVSYYRKYIRPADETNNDTTRYFDIKKVLAGCQILITLCKSKNLKEFYLGENGILNTLDPGAYCLDFSFCNAHTSREIQTLAALKDIHYVDAPFDCLGPEETTIMFVGGEEKPRNDLMPLLPYFANTIECYEKPGDGQIAIYIAYHALFSGILEASTLILCYRRMGLSKKGILKALNDANCNSHVYKEYIPKMLSGDYLTGITLTHWNRVSDTMLQIAEFYNFEDPIIENVNFLCLYATRKVTKRICGLHYLERFNENSTEEDDVYHQDYYPDYSDMKEIFKELFEKHEKSEEYEDKNGCIGIDYYDEETYRKGINRFNNPAFIKKLDETRKEIMKFINSHVGELNYLESELPTIEDLKRFPLNRNELENIAALCNDSASGNFSNIPKPLNNGSPYNDRIPYVARRIRTTNHNLLNNNSPLNKSNTLSLLNNNVPGRPIRNALSIHIENIKGSGSIARSANPENIGHIPRKNSKYGTYAGFFSKN